MDIKDQERIKEQIRVMQHYANGGKVETRGKNYNIPNAWWVNHNPDWNWCSCDYRIKKEPREFKMWIHKFENRQMNWQPTDPTELANWNLITVVEKVSET